MNRTAKGALIGGGVGALVAVAQTVRGEDDPPQVVAVQAVRGAAQGAVAGALVGWVLDRTAPARARAGWSGAVREAWGGLRQGAGQAVDAALPLVEDAVGRARDVALPLMEDAVDLARDRAVELAGELAELAELAEVARRRAA